jgi:hypothetical protein
MRRFYFTSENHCDGDNPCDDHCGNIRGARTIAKKLANELGETVYINDCEICDIEDCIEPDSILDETSESVENSESDTISKNIENSKSVENKITFTLQEVVYLKTLTDVDAVSYERTLKLISNNSTAYSIAKQRLDKAKLLIEKLTKLVHCISYSNPLVFEFAEGGDE